MDKFEKEITQQLQNDKLNFSADPAIHDRLMYHMQLKSAKATVRRNTFLPPLEMLFNTKLLSLKAGIAACLLIAFMGYKQINQNSPLIQLSDTAQVTNIADTINFVITDSVVPQIR